MTTKLNGTHDSSYSIESYLSRDGLQITSADTAARDTTARCFDDISQIGPVETGPVPRPPQFGRWAKVEQADLRVLPPVKKWQCLQTSETLSIDGCLDKPAWRNASWSEPFGLMHDGGQTSLETRVALLWNARFLYVAYKVEDHDIRASMTGFNDHVYLNDEDIELFIEGDDHYYEFGINPINTSYQIKWTWVEPLVRQQRFTELEELFKTPDYLYYVAREGECMGRHADLSYQLKGLQHAVRIDGTLNRPEMKDKGWSVELAIPWAGLEDVIGNCVPPENGDVLRMTAYRAHHDRSRRTVKGWTWSIMGNDNIHIPERWNEIEFLETEVSP